MRGLGTVLVAVCLAGIGTLTACGQYATKEEVAALRAELAATRDTMIGYWQANNQRVAALVAMDTTSPPPRCPPFCREMEALRVPMLPAPARTSPEP